MNSMTTLAHSSRARSPRQCFAFALTIANRANIFLSRQSNSAGSRQLPALGLRKSSKKMAEYNFTLILDGDVENHLDELFEAGCDDATFGTVDGVHYADFDREASSLAEAIASAIDDVESVPGLRVRRVEPDDLVTASEIAGRLQRKAARI